MSSILKNIASLLPDNIVFGESFRTAQKILTSFNESKDKIDFVQSYQNEKLSNIFEIAAKTSFYNHLNNSTATIDKLPFISYRRGYKRSSGRRKWSGWGRARSC